VEAYNNDLIKEVDEWKEKYQDKKN